MEGEEDDDDEIKPDVYKVKIIFFIMLLSRRVL